MKDSPADARRTALGELGLNNFPPYLMNRIMGRYNTSLRDELAALGLTTPQARALAVLAVNDGLLIRDLAVFAVVEQSTLSRALDRLQTDGKIRREADPDDSRGVRIFITPEGRATFEGLWPHMDDVAAMMFRDIPDEERRAFVATLHKMLSNVRQHEF
ncbi:MarR family winged helix-turn-helix transcriptional regulator [Chachezhania sediminis]|uniref:MarR family winged helix-turn-helix transcriptional regulator n=1 Tax=Chachezhania sediminis TaxID=2599291 RepID=UPI00131CAD8A|nr:MarR family transcriptional regulator [Chachezhania sediminis]